MANVTCVFVFDTDPSARRGLVRLLLAAGYDVRAFVDADEFVAAVGSEDTNCVVLDAGMPEVPVDELLAMFEKCRVYVPVIIVTTHDDRKTRRKAEKMNAAAFFRKPVDGTALLDAIDWALRTHSQNRSTCGL